MRRTLLCMPEAYNNPGKVAKIMDLVIVRRGERARPHVIRCALRRDFSRAERLNYSTTNGGVWMRDSGIGDEGGDLVQNVPGEISATDAVRERA